MDLKGTLRHVPQEGTLYTNPFEAAQTSNPDENFFEEFKETLAWDPKKVEVVKEVPVKKPEFQMDLESGASNMEEKDYKLKDSIENWPDFMYTRYHPRSVNLIKSYNYCEDYCSFDTFSIGQKLWSSEYFEDDFCDKIRVYIEECDFCQGFQTLFDAFDGFSGLTMKCFEYLHDEYSKTVFAMPVMSPSVKVFQNADENMSDSIRTVNTFLTYAHLPEHCDLFVPLSTMSRTWRNLGNPRTFPQFEYDVNNVYHSSAILASFLDTISLRYRLRNSSSSSVLSGFCSDLNGNGRKMASARLGLTLPMNEKEDFIDFLDRFEGELMQPLSPGSAVGTDRIIQAVAIRGIPKDRLKRPLQNAKHQMQMAAYKCSSVSEMMQLYFQCNNYASLSHVAAVEIGMSIRAPYPLEFFDSRFTSNGFIKEFSSEVKQGNLILISQKLPLLKKKLSSISSDFTCPSNGSHPKFQ